MFSDAQADIIPLGNQSKSGTINIVWSKIKCEKVGRTCTDQDCCPKRENQKTPIHTAHICHCLAHIREVT
ncbi:hypothetical protein XENTR_v10021870 [Xenopus tropicalis]|nr:hypothetical protein XENTR_v10021870 [Xenopus tropicalis]